MKLIISQNEIVRGIINLPIFTLEDRLDMNFLEAIPDTLTEDGHWSIKRIDESKEMTEDNIEFVEAI